MKNKSRKVQFIHMFRLCLREEVERVRAFLIGTLNEENLDFHDQCMTLFLLGEYTRISGNKELYEKYDGIVACMQDSVQKAAYEPCCRMDSEREGFYSDNFGMSYGALYNSNLFAKREKIAEAIHEMKNYAYDNYTCAGKLVDEKGGKQSTAQMLWLCIPFGLFTPEDLVLVAALDEMEKTEEPVRLAMLGWYFAEKSDYRKSRSYLSRLDDPDDFVQALKGVIEEKLTQAGMLSEEPVLHIPHGNFNRYQHQNYEREPWFPKEEEEVFVNAATWPSEYPELLEVCWETSHGRWGIAEGVFQKEYENYRFAMGKFRGGEEVCYFFRTGGYCSESFQFTTLEKETIIQAEQKAGEENGGSVTLRSDKGNMYLWSESVENGISHFSVSQMNEQENQNVIPWNEFSEQFGLPGVDDFRVEEIYFWKKGEEIFSSGIRMESEQDERFYGFGERYNNINQRGNKVDVYVYNQYKNQGIRTYFPMPYFLSSKEYGIYLATDCYTEFDMCSSYGNSWQMEAETIGLDWYCFKGKPKEMIGQFTSLTGRPVMMPEWAFGPWMSSNNWDSEAEVRKQAELTKKYDIPSTVLVIEAWSDEATYYIFNDAVYEENNGEAGFAYSDFSFPEWGKWPDPKGMVQYLHENGLKCILWQIPIIKYINSLHHLQADHDETYALSKGYCAKKADGTPYRMPEGWFTDSLLMDYTNKDAVDWWMKKRQYLVDEVEIDGFKTDGGEFVFGDDVQFSDGRTGKEMRNAYPNLYIGEHYRYINEKRDGIVFSRAGFTGAAQMPAHWAGDEKSTFAAFQRNLCAGLNAGISGVPFWGWDLAGFSGEIPSAELYARSASMAAFCPIMQYHAESKAEFNQDRTPWNIAERRNAPWVIDVYRYYAKLRMAMLPYIAEEAEKSVNTGVPMMRALWIEFPEDADSAEIFDQYMFGDDLMVAPVVEEGMTERSVYIPQGQWKNMFTGEKFEGGQRIQMKASVEEIIVLQREESKWKMCSGEEFQFTKEE